jgi:hypothetical protein
VGVNPADGLYVPLADTDAVPTVVPPVLQSVGAEDCGPNTVNVIVPVGLAPPDSVELIVPAAIAAFAVPLAGADTDVAVIVRTQLIFTDAGAVVFVSLESPGLTPKLAPPPPPPPTQQPGVSPPPPPPPPL